MPTPAELINSKAHSKKSTTFWKMDQFPCYAYLSIGTTLPLCVCFPR